MSTSKSSIPAPGAASVTLQVTTDDPSAEIFVINGQFNLVGRGLGPSQGFVLQPGLYKVKVVAGSETCEEHVALTPGSGVVTQHFSRLNFSSPAPLSNTSKTHEFHIAAAMEHSAKVHVAYGSGGSEIFVLARGWTEKKRTKTDAQPRQHPATGLTLLTEDGQPVANFETQSQSSLDWEPWAACNVSVPPGNYLLRLEVPSRRQTIEQTIVTATGWQTQVFLLQKDYAGTSVETGEKPDMRADLLGGSILMSHGGFDPGRDELRIVELARHALVNQRRILSRDLRVMLETKFENPMLGIFGAHLLLLEKQPDPAILKMVVDNLRNMLGHQHPDVEALALGVDPSHQFQFKTPPMLRRSWDLVCKATADNPELVPESSKLAKVADSLCADSIWLTWLAAGSVVEADATQAADPDQLTTIEEAILTQLKAVTHKERRRRARSGTPMTVSKDVSFTPAVTPDLGIAIEQLSSDTESIKKLTRQLGVPRFAVEKSLETLAQRDTRKYSEES